MSMPNETLDATSLSPAEMHAAVGEVLLQAHEHCPVVLSVMRPDSVVTLLSLDSLEPQFDEIIRQLFVLGWSEEQLTKLSEVLDARQRALSERP
jgi:hypothetical protein